MEIIPKKVKLSELDKILLAWKEVIYLV